MARRPEDDRPDLQLDDLIDRSEGGARLRRRGRALPLWRRLLRWAGRLVLALIVLALALVVAVRWVNPPQTYLMRTEAARLGAIAHTWVGLEAVAPVMARAVVAAEDANFCLHRGFDMAELRRAIEEGAQRGASTITQQVAKNVFLWPDRSWTRKAIEAMITPVIEVSWPKARVLEVYLNVAEFGEGVFGIHAAAAHHFATTPDRLSARQAALLAAILPDPRSRNPVRPSAFVQGRAQRIAAGAEVIATDGRAACFGP
jgi:monofunctional biosynthetic peptidoglycan transglycosylase